MEELMEAKKQLHEIQEQKESKSIKKVLAEAIDIMVNSCQIMKKNCLNL